MIKIAVDAMGGDFGVNTTIDAAMMAVKKFSDIEIILYGDKTKIAPLLKDDTRISIVDTKEVLDMGEHDPIRAIRKGKDTSMVMALKSLKEGVTDACVSSGPTQCLVAGAHIVVRKLDQISRVALCPIIPSSDGRGRLILDVGANVELKPEAFLEFAIAATIVARDVLHFQNPKVGLLNIGSEKGKGREVDNMAYELLESSKEINFVGNVEPNEVLVSDCDIFVTDGFTGNMVLKTLEGTGKTMGHILKEEIKSSLGGIIGYLFMKKNLKRFQKRLDSKEVGGAMILGVKAPVIKAHGSSDSYAFYNAIRQARDMVLNDVVNKLTNALVNLEGEKESNEEL